MSGSRSYKFNLFITGLILTAVARAQEPAAEAPTDFERRVFRIFKNSSPVSNEQWSELVGTRQAEVYTVQSGDTLWDISHTLFGDGFFWSKLWAENGGLQNPHEIRPRQRIHLMAGTEADAPSIRIGTGGEGAPVPEGGGEAPTYREQALKSISPEELASGGGIEVDELIPTPDIPPTRKRLQPVLKTLPPSFVKPERVPANQYDPTGLDAKPIPSLMMPAAVIPNSYLADHAVEGVGKVEEIEAQEKVAAFGQNLFIRLNRKGLIGEKLSAVLPKGNIKVNGKTSYGPIVEIGGRLQILEVVNEDKNLYRAVVIQSVNPISVGSVVTAENLPKTSFSRKGTRTTIDSAIIGGEFDDSRKLLGEGAVVYLDQGHRAGMNVGDILPVQSKRAERRSGSKLPDWSQPIGLLKLVRVEDSVATAIVLEAREEILIGDRTGGRLTSIPFIPEESVEPEKTE